MINKKKKISLSAQTSFGIGAILNATFGSLIELILYFFAISAGTLNSLVQAGITGYLPPPLPLLISYFYHLSLKLNINLIK